MAIKKPNVKLRNDAIKEIVISARDPVYFIENYCKIQHQKRGLIAFKLYEYQKECVLDMLAHDKNIINKARQLGFSTLMAAFVTWLILFHNDKFVLIISTKKDVAKNLLKKVKVILKNIPDWMYLADIATNQAHTLELSNGSWVKAIGRTDDAGRSESLSLLVIDEAAHIKGMEELWKGASSTVATGGKIVILSTPKGVGNFFHHYCKEAKSGENGYKYSEVFWWQNPEYSKELETDENVPGGKTSPWFRSFTAGWSHQEIAQELLTSFAETGDTYFEVKTIEMQNSFTQEPIKKIRTKFFSDNAFWIWAEAVIGMKYLIMCDIASGTGKDFSTAIVLEQESMEQAAEVKVKVAPDVFGKFLVEELGPLYNGAPIIIENNNWGIATAMTLRDSNYKNVVYLNKDNKLIDKWQAAYDNILPGFCTNMKNRQIILSKLEEYVRKGFIKIRSKRMLNEMDTFLWISGKPQAASGRNDDLIMALAIGVWVRELCFQFASDSKQDVANLIAAITIKKNDSKEILNPEKNAIKMQFLGAEFIYRM
jgi:hypothetical protein